MPWSAYVGYFQALAKLSPHLRAEIYGEDVEGQPLLLLTLSARENLVRMDDLATLQRRLTSGERLSPVDLVAATNNARAIVLVTCGIHPTEPAATAMTPGFVYDLATSESLLARRIRRECVVLVAPSLCPGGHEHVRRWHEATRSGPWIGSQPPGLYQRYTGHDNNRDWNAQTQPEIRTTVERVHQNWRPHVVIDLHQLHATGPRYVLPPWITPIDPSLDPALHAAGSALGQGIAARMTAQGLPGVATAAYFDAWSPSRAYAHYHGGVRILGEAAGGRIAAPVEVRPTDLVPGPGFDPDARSSAHPFPWSGGIWGLTEAARYHRVAVEAALDIVAAERATWVARQHAVLAGRSTDPVRAWVIAPSAVQSDPSAVARLVDALQAGEVAVHELSAAATLGGRLVPSGSLVVPLAQPFGSYAETLLEPRAYPGEGDPDGPYDTTAHALPLLMGVTAWDATIDADLSTTSLPRHWRPPSILLGRRGGALTWALSPKRNDVVTLVQSLLAAGVPVRRQTARTTIDGVTHPAGSWLVAHADAPRLEERLVALGISAHRLPTADGGGATAQVSAARVGVVRLQRTHASDGGWTRLVLETHGFAPIDLRPVDLRDGAELSRLDVVIIPRLAVGDLVDGLPATEFPPEWRAGIDRTGTDHLRAWVEDGGRLLLVDAATHLAGAELGLGVTFPLLGVTSSEAAAPGCIMEMLVDDDHPVAWGYDGDCAVMVTGSPTFAAMRGSRELTRVGWIAPGSPLLAGYLPPASARPGGIALGQLPLGDGLVTLYGFRPFFRAQSLASYRFVFNAINQPRPVASPDRNVSRPRKDRS